MKKIAAFLVFVFLITASASLGYFWNWLNSPVMHVASEYFEVRQGDTLLSVSERLKQDNTIRFPRVWRAYARLQSATHILAGEFAITEQDSPKSILKLLQSSNVRQYQVTLVEGTTISEVVLSLKKQDKLVKSLPSEFDPKYSKLDGIDKPHLEGWFFPDTYNFVAGESDYSILMRAHKRLLAVLDEEWQQRAEGLPYTTPYEALIMASIIEKETGAPHERKEIAGVFVRRLLKRMRLQTDPTVIYGMGQAYNGNITRADLKRPTAYNTYVIHGLPPTPIALVGRAAIHAALHPAEGESLYFVAKGDGTHYFSNTLDEHLAAVKKYQLIRRESYRSTYEK